jgi:hypothetical protein
VVCLHWLHAATAYMEQVSCRNRQHEFTTLPPLSTRFNPDKIYIQPPEHNSSRRKYTISDLTAGTADTGRVHPRRTAGRRVRWARVDGFFFSKPYPTRLIPVPVAGTRVRGTRAHESAGWERDESAGQTL